MWSGKSGLNNWALQSQKYQNMNHDEVDWALLAKQWIQLKESNDTPPPLPMGLAAAELLQNMQPPPPPPMPQPNYPDTQPLQPPGISLGPESATENAGSVDMEIEEDKETSIQQQQQQQQYHNNGDAWKNWSYNTGEDWQNNHMHTSWGYNYQMDQNRVAPGLDAASNNMQQGQTSKDQNHYWGQQNMATPSGIMMQKVVDYGHKDRRGVPRDSYSDNSFKTSELNSSQRKQLPAWIRDGLEKMEREKHRTSEQEEIQRTQEEILRKKRDAEERARKLLQEYDDGVAKPPVKSKFDSDSDNSDDAEEDDHNLSSEVPKESSTENRSNDVVSIREPGHGLDEVLTTEEKMTLMMGILKTTMIEILLEVTTELILDVCTKVVGKAKMKGLDVYGDSAGESDVEDEGNAEEAPVVDSDDDLQQTIDRKRGDFEEVERDILRRLQKEEEDKREDAKASSRESSPDSSSQEVPTNPDTEESPKSIASAEEDADPPEVASEETELRKESESNSESSVSKSSSGSYVKKKKKKKKSKARRNSSDDSDTRKRRKKRKKTRDHSRSRSKSRRRRSVSRSVKTKSRRRYSRSRSRSPVSSRKKHSRSRSVESSRHKRRRRSRSRRNRRSNSRSRYAGGRHRRSSSNRRYRRSNSRRRDTRSGSRRRRRSRSVDIRERSNRRSRS